MCHILLPETKQYLEHLMWTLDCGAGRSFWRTCTSCVVMAARILHSLLYMYVHECRTLTVLYVESFHRLHATLVVVENKTDYLHSLVIKSP